MNAPCLPVANRILVIDDNVAIHEDFRKILAPQATADHTLREAEALLFGEPADKHPASTTVYRLDTATQGQEGLKMVERAAGDGQPYALAFVDIRMPPGWDGVETIAHIWQKFPELPIVVCTAYTDYSWSEMMSKLGYADNLVILRKPFEAMEVLQLAHSLTRKWLLAWQVRAHIEELDALVQARTGKLQEANEALRCSEERFAKSFRASPVPLALQNAGDQRYVDVNDSFLQLTDFDRSAVIGRTPIELSLFSQPEMMRGILEASSAHHPVRNLQCELHLQNGKALRVLLSVEMIELGGQPHCLVSFQDITERLAMEEQLRQAQKMEAVGQIAAGIAHDFNNILTVIQGHAELQLNMGKLDESAQDSLQEISRAAGRAASLTRQLLAFSRKQMLHRRPLDVSRTLHNLSKMLHRVLGEPITLRIECADNLPLVFADAINFEQIIINLAVNARDAMPKGGPLTITADCVITGEEYKKRTPDAMIGAFVCVCVTDKGSGMDEIVRRRIFEPFFTTKDVGKGTGMGLATVYGIVKQHQGWIEVQSQPGAGSVFKVFLPVTDQEVQKIPESKPDLNRVLHTQSRTIFLVEDETPLREMASKVLKQLGYQVVVAGNGLEALALWPQHRGKVDLLLTDMVMPGGITGRELADCLLHDAPGMPVIYSTGYSTDLIDSDANFIANTEWLFKPYDASTLAKAVKKVFGNGN